MKYKNKRKASVLLTFIGAGGVVATAILSAKATPKALKVLGEAKKHKTNLTKLEIFKYVAPCYIPAVVVGTSTIVCIFGVNILNKNKNMQAALASAYITLDNTFKQYKAKTTELYGKDGYDPVENAIAEDKYKKCNSRCSADKQLFYDVYSDRFFESTLEDVLEAEYHLNRNFVLKGDVELNELYRFLYIDPIKDGDVLGWSFSVGSAFYGYSWIDFRHSSWAFDDGTVYTAISMPFAPTPDYLDF